MSQILQFKLNSPNLFLHHLKISEILQTNKVDPKISTLRGMKAVTNISVEIQSLQKENLTKLIKTYKKICFILGLLT